MEIPLPRFFFFFVLLLLLLLVVVPCCFLDSSRSDGAVLPQAPRSVHHRLRKPPLSIASSSSSSHGSSGPYNFFEVTRPVGRGAAEPDCSILVLQHAFANTYSSPPAMARYNGPPAGCDDDDDDDDGDDDEDDGDGGRSGSIYPRIVLKWSGSCKGRQYDRIAGLWFGGVELLRTCTAEPTSSGVYWEVRKDVSRYASLLMQPQDVVLELANVVDSTYTGIFYINVTLEFFYNWRAAAEEDRSIHGDEGKLDAVNLKLQEEGEDDGDDDAQEEKGSISINGEMMKKKKEKEEEKGSMSINGEMMKKKKKEIQKKEKGSISINGEMKKKKKKKKMMMKKKEKKEKMGGGSGGMEHGSFRWPPAGPADLIVPVSQRDAIAGQGHWFHIAPGSETGVAEIAALPANAMRAVLELCVSFHGDDEFWYTNPPNEYLDANGLRGQPGNGPFREVEVLLLPDADADADADTNMDTDTGTDTDADTDTDTQEELVLGAAWPFPTVFTGGINPLFWRPAAAIGAFDLPTYDLDLTPFLGLLADGESHRIGLRVRNANGSWPLDANLHLWLDPRGAASVRLLAYDAPPPSVSHSTSGFSGGLDGEFRTSARRSLSFSASVSSPTFGPVLVNVSYSFTFDNLLAFCNASSVQVVTQSIESLAEVSAVATGATDNASTTATSSPSSLAADSDAPVAAFWQQRVAQTFPLYLYCSIESADDDADTSSYTQVCNLTHSFVRSSSTISASAPPDADADADASSASDSLNNWQAAQGSLEVVDGSLASGVGALQQQYAYTSTYPGCYSRVLSTRNYSVLYDTTNISCDDDASLVASL